MSRRTRVLVIDDSALMRRVLSEILARDPQIEVVGTATDAYVARDKIKRLNPDVLTLDIEMPLMDGISFLRNLMRLRPMPVVMCSSLTQAGADVTLQALSMGAVDFIAKPRIDTSHAILDYAEEIAAKVKAAAGARVRPLDETRVAQPRHSADAVLPRRAAPRFRTTDQLIAIGASTGGTEAIRAVLVELPPDTPGIVVTQHIPAAFSASFAERLNASCAMTVTEAKDGQQILPGHVYIAPGDRHLLVVRDGTQLRCELNDGSPVNRHKPSVDVMLRSVAQNAGSNAIGLILTGMGKDGAAALGEMRESGAATLAQDEATSVVWGMPGAAWHAGAVEELLPLERIGERLMQLVHARAVASSVA